jgi:hypothetical protein
MADGRRTRAAAVVAGLGALLLTAPPPGAAVAQLAGTATSTDPTGPLVAAVALLAWVVTAWLALTGALVLLSRLPGVLGRLGRALVARVAPVAVRRAVETALGLTVAVGALAPTAALAAPVPSPSVTVDAGWDLDWPSRSAADAVAPPSAAAPTAAPPTAPPPSSVPSARAPVRPAAGAVPRPAPVPPGSPAVVVRAGDSLWSLAEASLRSAGTAQPTDRQVAQAWPRWWAANRSAVGDDPDLLLPGTVLRPPPP